MNMTLETYIDEELDTLSRGQRKRVHQVMKKYGENRWWSREADPVIAAWHQLHEPIGMISGRILIRGLSILLGRSTYMAEIVYNNESIVGEADRCYRDKCYDYRARGVDKQIRKEWGAPLKVDK